MPERVELWRKTCQRDPFMIKTLQKISIEGTYLNIVKGIYDESAENIVLNGEKLKAFPLSSGT